MIATHRPHLGDINEEGLIFWAICKGKQKWLTKDQFVKYRETHKRNAVKWRNNNLDYYYNQKSRFPGRSVNRSRQYYLANVEACKKRSATWASENPERKRQISVKANRKRRKTNNVFRLRVNVSNRINCALRRRGETSRKTTIKLLGCTARALSEHLESLFQPGMTWDNWSLKGWHIDHIIPLATARNIGELEALCHHTNLQPLWARDNLRKGKQHPAQLQPQ